MSIDFEKKESSLSVFAWMAILQPSTNRWGMICVLYLMDRIWSNRRFLSPS